MRSHRFLLKAVEFIKELIDLIDKHIPLGICRLNIVEWEIHWILCSRYWQPMDKYDSPLGGLSKATSRESVFIPVFTPRFHTCFHTPRFHTFFKASPFSYPSLRTQPYIIRWNYIKSHYIIWGNMLNIQIPNLLGWRLSKTVPKRMHLFRNDIICL